MRYRNKPVEVEAMQLTFDNHQEVAAWCGGVSLHAPDAVLVVIPLLKGDLRAYAGDYVVRTADGTFSVVADLVFETQYEAVEPEVSVAEEAPAEPEDLWAPCEVCGAEWVEHGPSVHKMFHADDCPNNPKNHGGGAK